MEKGVVGKRPHQIIAASPGGQRSWFCQPPPPQNDALATMRTESRKEDEGCYVPLSG